MGSSIVTFVMGWVFGVPCSVDQINQLSVLQRKCIRLVDYSIPACEVFKRLRILTVSELVNLEQGKLGYKLCRGLLPSVLTRLMLHDSNNCTIVKSHSYMTRQKHIPNRPNAKLSLYRRSFLYQAISSYSELNDNLRNSTTLSSFMRQFKRLLIGI